MALTPAPKVRFYRNIVATFVALNIVLLVFVVYLSLVKATITIKPKNMPVTTQFIADVVAKPERSTEIPGAIVAETFEKAKEFAVAGGVEAPGKAGGQVTLINNTSKSQPLVVKTRIQTTDKLIYRLTKNVTVPVKGSVDVDVVADVEGAAGNIPPTSFTIPGLPVSLQKDIYAESKEAMVGGVIRVAKVEQADLDKALKELTEEIYKDAQKTLTESHTGFTGKAFSYTVTEKKSDTTPGTQAGLFIVSAKLKVVGVFHDQAALLTLAKIKLFAATPKDLSLLGIQSENIAAALDKYDLESAVANLKVSATGMAQVKEGGSILSRDKLAGWSIGEATSYLKGFEEIEDVKIDVRPFWMKALPKLKDHIEIRIVE